MVSIESSLVQTLREDSPQASIARKFRRVRANRTIGQVPAG